MTPEQQWLRRQEAAWRRERRVVWLYVAMGIGGLVGIIQQLNDSPGLIGGFLADLKPLLADLFRWLAAR